MKQFHRVGGIDGWQQRGRERLGIDSDVVQCSFRVCVRRTKEFQFWIGRFRDSMGNDRTSRCQRMGIRSISDNDVSSTRRTKKVRRDFCRIPPALKRNPIQTFLANGDLVIPCILVADGCV